MTVIYEYDDYRKFLADYYQAEKARQPAFSYQNFSRAAGFASKSFIFNVIQGRKNLSPPSVVKVCQAVGLSPKESAYFEKLVAFNQAVSFQERDFFHGQLQSFRPWAAGAGGAQKLRRDQFEFYSQWYNLAIWSFIDLFPYDGDYKKLSNWIRPAITVVQARRSVELLTRLGLVKKWEDGTYAVTSRKLTTGPEVQSLAVQRFHLASMQLAAKALKELPSAERNITGLTVGISKTAYAQVCDKISRLRQEILDLAAADKDADRVYNVNFQIYPISKPSPPTPLPLTGEGGKKQRKGAL